MPKNRNGFSSVLFLVIGVVALVSIFLLGNLKTKAPSKSGAAISPLTVGTQSLPSYVDSVSYAATGSLQWNHTVSGANRLLVVSAAYRSEFSSQGDEISGLTYASQGLTRVNRTQNGQVITEVWYLKNPPVGTNLIIAGTSNNVVDLVLTGTSFVNVNQTTPLTTVGSFSNSGRSTTPELDLKLVTGGALGVNDIVYGVTASYTGDANVLSVSGGTTEVWHNNTENTLASGEVATQANASKLSWSQTVSWPWAVSAVGIRLLSNPTAISTDLKINGSDGPISVAKDSSLNISWSTQNAQSCLASGAWTGTKATTGTATATASANVTFTLTCTGVSGSKADSVAVTVSLFDKARCWERSAIFPNGTAVWTDPCRGYFSSYQKTSAGWHCPISMTPVRPGGPNPLTLSSNDLTQLNAWVAARKPKTPCQ